MNIINGRVSNERNYARLANKPILKRSVTRTCLSAWPDVRVVQIGHHRLVAGDGLEAAELLREVREADGVAEDELGPPVMQMTGRFSL